MRVKIYYNTRKKAFSVVALEGDDKNKVIMHTDSISLRNCSFRVGAKGRERVLREGKKNVHAYVYGEIEQRRVCCTTEIYYSPYRASTFVRVEDWSAIETAQYAQLRIFGEMPTIMVDEANRTDLLGYLKSERPLAVRIRGRHFEIESVNLDGDWISLRPCEQDTELEATLSLKTHQYMHTGGAA